MKLTPHIVTSLVFVLFMNASTAQTVVTENFDAPGPFPSNSLPMGWSQANVVGVSAYNFFNREGINALNPTCQPYSGIGMLCYNSFAAPAGEAAVVISRPYNMTWMGTNTANFRFWMYRDSGPGFNRIEVYINNQPTLTGATLLVDTANGLAALYGLCSSNPVVPCQGPAYFPSNWHLYGYTIPAGATWSIPNLYVLIKGYSQFGNNIYIDDFSIDTYPSTQVFQSTELVLQNSLCISPASTNNWIACARVAVSGLLAPYTIDSMLFSSSGSTNPAINIAPAGVKLWYTGCTKFLDLATAIQVGPALSPLSGNFVFYPQPSFTMTFDTNYFWLTYDINNSPPPVIGDCLDADYAGIGISNGLTLNGFHPATVTSLPGCRTIGLCPCIPLSTNGTFGGDYVSKVVLPGDAGPPDINNIYNTVGPNGVPDYMCAHPPDYENFVPGPITSAILTADGLSIYSLQACVGTYFSGNCLAAWIDFNHDGIFNTANYTGVIPGGEKLLQTVYPPGLAGCNPNIGVYNCNNINFTIPINTPYNGSTILRVRQAHSNNNIDPCATLTFGETEDYTVYIIPPTGINDLANNNSLNIISVESNQENTINIQFYYNSPKPCTLTIADVAGRIIESQKEIKPLKGINKIAVQKNITNGVYIITMQNDLQHVSRKFSVIK